MAIDAAQTARGALAGAVAAGVWALQQPADKRVFGVDYDDAELLGKLVTRGRAWPLFGTAIHLANGALFGAVYANVAPRLPLPSWARGPLAGLTEHGSTWPAMALVDRFHPARDEMPRLATSLPAFAQATWRHLLFGTIMGELERRMNPPAADQLPSYDDVVSSNGHGDIEHAVAGRP
jgi:hypothetical protein